MTVGELIAKLEAMPEGMEVCAWNEDEDDYVPIQDVLWEEGHTSVDLLTIPAAR